MIETMKTNSKVSLYIFCLISLLAFNGCSGFSNTASSNATKPVATTVTNTLNVEQKIENGVVLAVKAVNVPAEPIQSYGNVGVVLNSGGSSGIQGSVDLKTIGTLYRNLTKNRAAQEIIVKKETGETVAITQSRKDVFKVGERVKILKRGTKAVVVH